MTDQRPFTCHLFIGTSLDGFIARTNGDLEWLTSRGEAAGEYGFQEFLDRIDTVAMGRVTYENWLSLGPEQWPFHGKHVLLDLLRVESALVAARPGQVLLADKNYHGGELERVLAGLGLRVLRPARKGHGLGIVRACLVVLVG